MELFKLFGTILVNGSEQAKSNVRGVGKQAEETQGTMANAFKKIGSAVVTYFAVDKIINFGTTCVNVASDIRASTAQFEQTFGTLGGEATKIIGDVAKEGGMLATRLQDSGTKIYAFAKTTGMDSTKALDLMNRALIVASDSSAYYDRSLEDTTETLQSFLKGNYANDSALGLSCTETTRNTKANKLYGKSFKELSEEQKQLTLLAMVEDANKLSGALGQASRESDSWTNVTGNLKEAWRQFQGVLGQPVLDYLIPTVQKLSDGVQWMTDKVTNADVYYQKLLNTGKEVQKWLKEHKTQLQLVAIAVGTVTTAVLAFNASTIAKIALDALETAQIYALIVAEKLHTATTWLATTATTAFGTAVAFLTSPITLVIVAIGALIAIGVLLYKNWDTVKAKALEMWQSVTKTFDNLKASISTKVESIKQKVSTKFNEIKKKMWQPIEEGKKKISGIVETVKGFFSGMKLKFPKIDLPHFSIKPKGWKLSDLLDGVKPTIGIDWYAKAMNNPLIMTQPTAFGYNADTGRVMVGGERGSEIVSGTNTLMNMIRQATSSGNVVLLEVLTQIRDLLADKTRWHDIFVEALADGSFSVVIDGREMGRIVRKYA